MKRALFITLLSLLVILMILTAFYLKRPQQEAEENISVFFTDSDNIERAIISVIDSAKESIDIAIYSLNKDRIKDALISAKKRGVNVRVVTERDNYNNPLYRPTYRALKSAGIPIRLDNNVAKFENLMHNKFIVIDKKMVWTGSLNLTKSSFSEPNDALLIDSPELASAYRAEFCEMFEEERWGLEKRDNNREVFIVDGAKIELYITPSDRVQDRVIDAINSAKESIHIAMFYLTNDFIYKALKRAIERGVKVMGVFDEDGAENKYSEADEMVAEGYGVLDRFSGYLHHKFCIIDRKFVITGSANWSSAGMRYNDENTAIIHSPEIAALYLKRWQKLYKR
jgi:phosphatidylserine/phosphatidylglycerophosphate/cardiolipin synthase-like enzyme